MKFLPVLLMLIPLLCGGQEAPVSTPVEPATGLPLVLRVLPGQVFLEISIVLASLAILSKRPMLWWLSVICTTVGLIIASSTALINRDATRASPTRAQHDSNARPTATQTGCNMSVDLVHGELLNSVFANGLRTVPTSH